ncbi:MAG: hypothetical protein ACTSYC_07095 [Promethearchaeota archaeon]
MKIEKKEHPRVKNGFRKKWMMKIIILAIYTALLAILYLYIMSLNTHPLVAFLTDLFLFLAFLGVIIKGKNIKSFYSRLFPSKKERIRSQSQTRRMRHEFKKEIEDVSIKEFEPISLDFKYKKALLRKCDNCGMILPAFAKKCYNCGKDLS